MKKLIEQSKAIVAALAVNTVIAVMKFIVAAFSGSASMFSEGIHSAADTLNQVVLLVGKRTAQKKRTPRHPFGYARVTFFASFLVASLLFFVGGAFSLLEAVEKVEQSLANTGAHTLDMQALLIAAGILVVSIALEAFSLRTALREVHEEQVKEGTRKGLLSFYHDTRNSSLIVIVTEDLAALLGLVLALTGVVATLLTHNPLWDALGGAAIGLLLITAAFILGKEITSLIIGEALPVEKLAQIEELIAAVPHTQGIRDLKTVAIGADTVLVEADVYFADDGSVSAAQIMSAINSIKSGVKQLWVREGIYVSTCIEAVSLSCKVLE